MAEPARRPARSFFATDPVRLAKRLLGQRLVSVADGCRTAGIIVETEAYLGTEDRAAHTYGGRRTARNASMWGPPGRAYVYLIYGMHCCVNVVAGTVNDPVAVLIRALRPEAGLAAMRARRSAARRDTDLCSGPGKLCQAMAIDRLADGANLVSGTRLYLEQVRQRALPYRAIAVGKRVGVDYAGEWAHAELRFAVRDDPNVSRPAPAR
jgi:DNA-3-methyladenine glycosylase